MPRKLKDNLYTAVLVNSLGRHRSTPKPIRLIGGRLIPGEKLTFTADKYGAPKRHGVFNRTLTSGILEIRDLKQ